MRTATERQLAKIQMDVQKDWFIPDEVRDLTWKKDLSILGIQQASRLIKYLSYYDEHTGWLRYAKEMMERLPDSTEYRKLKVIKATMNGGTYEDEKVTIQ